MLLGCIADDFTGATDLANTLTRKGMASVQYNGLPGEDQVAAGEDAAIVALKTRSIPAEEAVEQSLAALAWLRRHDCRKVFFKYCSTFDSTDEGNIGPVAEALMAALDSDFQDNDIIRHHLGKAPKYGNDDPTADAVLTQVFDAFHGAVTGRPNTRGGVYRINLLPTTCHVYFGEVTGALPDGRKNGVPLSEGISPVQGADCCGPTAVLNSAAKIDHLKTGGTLLNQKFLPEFLASDKGRTAVVQLIRSYFKMDGHHIQFNVVDADTLRKAQDDPESYRDLIVRVAGYSDYFINLTTALQEEIINRTAHTGM